MGLGGVVRTVLLGLASMSVSAAEKPDSHATLIAAQKYVKPAIEQRVEYQTVSTGLCSNPAGEQGYCIQITNTRIRLISSEGTEDTIGECLCQQDKPSLRALYLGYDNPFFKL